MGNGKKLRRKIKNRPRLLLEFGKEFKERDFDKLRFDQKAVLHLVRAGTYLTGSKSVDAESIEMCFQILSGKNPL